MALKIKCDGLITNIIYLLTFELNMHPVQSAFDIWQSNFKVKILLAIQKAIQNGILFDCNVIGGNHQFDHNALFQNLIDSGNFSTRIEIFENLKRYYLDWNNAPYNFKPELLFRYHTRYQKEIGSIVLDKNGINDPIFEGTLCQMALQRYYNKITNFFIVINWNVQSCWKVSPHIFYDRNFASQVWCGKIERKQIRNNNETY